MQESKWQKEEEKKGTESFVDLVQRQTHLFWGLPSKEGNPLV